VNCQECRIMVQINEKRQSLNKLIREQGGVLSHTETIKTSQELDLLILACYECRASAGKKKNAELAGN
jgi:hypothetical protein